MKPLKQCDPRWGNKKLGNSTLCKIGCTCTALAMLAGTTPDKIVDEAQFTAGGAIYWKTLKSLKFHWRGDKYENDKVLKAIKDYGGCLVEVAMPGAPGGKHWVLYIGDKKMNDPLTGKTESTSKYKPTGYAILEPKETNMSDTIQIKKSTFEELVKKATERDEFEKMGYDKPEKIKEEIEKLKQDRKKCELEKSQKEEELNAKIDSISNHLNTEIDDLTKELADCEKSKAGLKGEITKKEKEIEELKKQLEEGTPVLEGKRKLLAGILSSVLVFISKFLSEKLGFELSVQELALVAIGGLSYVTAEGTKDIIEVLKNLKTDKG